MTRARRRLAHLSVLAALIAPTSASARQAGPAPGAAEEDLDQKAKRLFVAGKYAEAIDILARLYTETSNPVYLRNIARCYQRLREPDRAIASFEEYLLRARNVSKTEREEIRGFIRELEELKRARTADRTADKTADASRPPPPSEVRPPAAPAPAPASPPLAHAPAITSPPAGTSTTASPPLLNPGPLGNATVPPPVQPEPALSTFPAGPPEGEVSATPGRPLARTVAMAGMALAGAMALGGGIFFATSWARYKSAEKSCVGKYWCAQDAAKVVESRSRLSKILLIGAGVTGAASVTVFLLNPAQPSSVALGLGGRF